MKNRTTSPNITKLKKNEIFVFGSNAEGKHIGGAAKIAKDKFKAKEGIARGLTGNCYAIDTMSGIDVIKEQIEPFINQAKHTHPQNIYLVTEIGCGIAGFRPEQIAPLFKDAIDVVNIHLPESFWNVLNAKPMVKGYKVFNPDFTCRGFQYAENTEYKHEGKIEICSTGLHFCSHPADCFSYYSFDPKNIVCEVEALGEVKFHNEDSKVVTNHLKIGRKLTLQEVLVICNSGKDNTGLRNSGDRNSGNWNSGNRNSGDRNSGNWNSGNRNSGDWNSGYRNSGDRNSGDRNSGNWNSGNRNSGDWNSGYWNSGNWNSGDSNSGYRNSGDRNSGNWNSGNRNSGDSNSGYRNSGAFCLDPNPKLWLFDKLTDILVKDWENSKAVRIMNEYLNQNMWIWASEMTEKEKEKYPSYATTDGYLKTISLQEAWANMWGNLTDENKAVFTALPNFDTDKFFKITGIKVK